jgi:hypothetical protein
MDRLPTAMLPKGIVHTRPSTFPTASLQLVALALSSGNWATGSRGERTTLEHYHRWLAASVSAHKPRVVARNENNVRQTP